MSAPEVDAVVDEVPRGARRLVSIALVLLLTAGLIGFEAWPLTAWRLFSLARKDQQTMWVVRAELPDGSREVSLEELPLEYRHAAWPMADLPGASLERRDEVCAALRDAVLDVEPDLQRLEIVRDRQRLVEEGGEWIVRHDAEVVHTCAPGGAP